MTTVLLRHVTALAAATVLVMTVTTALLPPNAAALETMSRPDWTPGDYWAYQVTLSGGWGSGAQGTMRAEVLGEENLSVAGVVYPTYHARIITTLHSLGGGSESNETTQVDQWLTKDLAGLRTVTNGSTGLAPMTRERITVPPVGVPWPLAEGQAWNWTMEETVTTTVSGYQQNETSYIWHHFEVLSNATVQVESGTFVTLPLRESDGYGAYVDSYWSARVGHWVRQVSVTSDGTTVSTYTLTSYNYQAGASARSLAGSAVPLVLALGAGAVIVAAVTGLLLRRRARRWRLPKEEPMEPPLPPPPPSGPG